MIIGILMGFVSAALLKAREKAKRTRMTADMQTLASAMWNYRHEYAEWPVSAYTGSNISRTVSEVIDYIDANNPKGVRFANWSEYDRDSNGEVLSPVTRTPYYASFNFDADTVAITTNAPTAP